MTFDRTLHSQEHQDDRLAELGAGDVQPRQTRKLATVMIVVSMAFAIVWLRFVPARAIDGLLIATLIMGCAAMFASRIEHLMSVLIPVLAFNREARRMLDWQLDDYAEVPITSLAASLVMLTMGLSAINSWQTLPKWTQTVAKLYFGAIAVSLVVGIKTYKLGAIYTAVTWVAPFMVFLYVIHLKPTQSMLRRWMITWVSCSVFAMAYGWVQWSTLPPWSKFWMVNADMASMGLPIPMRCRFFGPCSGPGSLASLGMFGILFLAFGFRRTAVASLPLILFLAVSLLMTQARSTLITLLIACALTPLLMRGGRSVRAIIIVIAVVFSVVVILPYVPGGGGASRRVQTLLSVQEDRSFQGRAEFSTIAAAAIATNPLGFGMGSTGLGSRVDGGYSMQAFDNGYLAVLFTLGFPGAMLLAVAAWLVIKQTVLQKSFPGIDPRLVALCKAVFVAHLFLLLPSNWLDNENAFVFWMLLGFLAVSSKEFQQNGSAGSEEAGFDEFDHPSDDQQEDSQLVGHRC